MTPFLAFTIPHLPLTLKHRQIPLLRRRQDILSGWRLLSLLVSGHRDSRHASLVRFGYIFSVKRSGRPCHFCVLMLSHTHNMLARILCSISTGITCLLVRGTLGPSPAMARNSGLRARADRKVATTAANCNKQGDVQAMQLGIPSYPGYDDRVLMCKMFINNRTS